MLQKSYKQFQGSPFRVGGSTQHERNMETTLRTADPWLVLHAISRDQKMSRMRR
jgi:hypothetical protein